MDEAINVSITKNRMEAYIVFSEADEEGEKLPFERVMALIANAKVVYGVEESFVKTIYDHREYEREYKIAEGKEAVDGEDGKIEYRVDITKDAKPKIDIHGNVDYLNVDKFVSVQQGQTLAIYTPPTQGESGVDVTGQVIKAKNGKPARMPLGKNVQMSEDGVTIVSKIDGLLEYIDGRLYVEPVLYINGDVDLSTGNIDFIGNVSVRGNVRSGMKVIAQGDIHVDGMVESAYLDAAGDIVINGGVKGMDEGRIKAKGNLSARYIESAIVEVKGVVTATAILQSDINSLDGVTVIGTKGAIIGGNTRAKNFVDCKNIGNRNNIETVITVGVSPEQKKEISELSEELKKIKDKIANVSRVAQIPDEGLTEQQKEIKAKAVRQRKELMGEVFKKETRMKQLNENLKTNMRSYISVFDTAYAGTVLNINNSTMIIHSDYKFTTFRDEDGEIVATQHA